MRCIVKPSGLNKIRSRGHYRAEKRNCKPAAGKCNRECRRYPCALVGQIFGELRQVGVSSYPPDIVMTSEKFPCVDLKHDTVRENGCSQPVPASMYVPELY